MPGRYFCDSHCAIGTAEMSRSEPVGDRLYGARTAAPEESMRCGASGRAGRKPAPRKRNIAQRSLIVSSMVLAAMFVPAVQAQVRLSESTGVNLFKNNCTSCHGTPPVEHAPSESAIKQMPPERI